MTDTIRPALTPEEWAEGRVWDGACVSYDGGKMLTIRNDDYYAGYTEFIDRRHALAALALHGQPFGFTREMVDAIASALGVAEGEGWGRNGYRKLVETAIENIRALLPPEAT